MELMIAFLESLVRDSISLKLIIATIIKILPLSYRFTTHTHCLGNGKAVDISNHLDNKRVTVHKASRTPEAYTKREGDAKLLSIIM
ncbi:hypothetical protein CEXT_789331 [Caerostris extrusa]|uniref:Uncharacterized protein n=1 Tax=Caerostris extrusa TaxID=172846 RepID=A0AAV4VV84_CAEEX|nr:hypothetical protein CEXT_789331 [Caerostris extrusa]